jgi:NADPH-dependent glutamate synthase beta subunit-like oxidoreductase/NAD-dependent dihydropyrimidine dehydrogenase PreA subunit
VSGKPCPVNQTLLALQVAIESGRLSNPRSRRIAEEVLELLRDVAWGRAGADHLGAIASLTDELAHDAASPGAMAAAQSIWDALDEHREVFQSHIDTHNCATGECVRLVPAPCQMTCPAGIDVPTYVNLIGRGHDAEAIEVIRRDNPFPWVCGLVCTRPCEFMCVRGRVDKPISIKFLKAFAAERALSDRHYRNPAKEPDKGRRIAVIGAGPGGLTAAYYLALKGYGVTVFEALPVAGGMMMLGIPRYRLPREVIDREVAMLEDLGVEFRFDTRYGKDITLAGLKAGGFDAVFLAIGAHQSFKLNIPGENDFPQVIEAVDLLRRVALGDRRIPGKHAVIVGGGNVAIDAARTCLRLGSEEVTIAYRRTRAEMPADVEEVEQAEDEGIHMSFLTIPKAVIGKDGRLTGLECIRARLVRKDDSERLFPVPVEGSDFVIAADTVISAIGQRIDLECLRDLKGLKWSRRQTIQANTVSMETSVPGVFAGGDAVTGPATVVEAIGAGKRAAEAIDRYLSGIPQPKMPPVPVRRSRVEWMEVPATTKMALRRPEMPLLNLERRRTTFQQVELGYTENVVREEARRCLRCDICLRCGKCVEICRDMMGVNALEFGFLNFDQPGATDFRVTAERCILCGACAANCPNDAIRIIDRGDERLLSYCGTILNRQKLERCQECGSVLGPQRYLEFLQRRTQGVSPVVVDRRLCHACARRHTARVHTENSPA